MAPGWLATRRPIDTTDPVGSAIELIGDGPVAALTGAGVSTDSGIPDYRGRGTPVRTPMSFQQFVNDPDFRRRYWAGSHAGWHRFGTAAPNAGHEALAGLEDAGVLSGIVTQNVDGLHTAAGTQKVVELHGSMRGVHCLTCGQDFARDTVAERLESANPWLSTELGELAPDGDVAVERYRETIVPECSVCGGILKPDVVFFGEFVPAEVFQRAAGIVEGASALLVAGSSLVVNSGVRLVRIAQRRRIPIIVINRGPTKLDRIATLRIEGGTTPVLTSIAAGYGL